MVAKIILNWFLLFSFVTGGYMLFTNERPNYTVLGTAMVLASFIAHSDLKA